MIHLLFAAVFIVQVKLNLIRYSDVTVLLIGHFKSSK